MPASMVRSGARAFSPSIPSSLLQDNRDHALDSRPLRSTLDWAPLRIRVQTSGMRNSNTLAIAPTATISNICGVTQSIEPTYQNLFVKSNMSGDFTVVNASLVNDLKARGLWDEVMISRPEVLRWLAGLDRPRSGRPEAAVCDIVRGGSDLADSGRCVPAEVDRSGAVAESVY